MDSPSHSQLSVTSDTTETDTDSSSQITVTPATSSTETVEMIMAEENIFLDDLVGNEVQSLEPVNFVPYEGEDENLKGKIIIDVAPINYIPCGSNEILKYERHVPHVYGSTHLNDVTYDGSPVTHPVPSPGPTQDGKERSQSDTPARRYCPFHPSVQERADNFTDSAGVGFVLTGSAAKGNVGRTIGHMDVAESEDSYMFRVALPGVKKDESEFQIDHSGKVTIRGITTTGDKYVDNKHYSQVFEMKTRNLCPSGPFSISFQLPGQVLENEFSGNFGIDGILQGIVKKAKHTTPTSQP